MKDRIKEIIAKPAFKLLVLSVVWIMIVIPILGTFNIVDKALRVSWVFTIFNTIFAALIGSYTRLRKLNIYLILIFPAVFIIQVIIRYGSYGYLFGAIYLLVSLLSYILTTNK